jgi:hypothetical protein
VAQSAQAAALTEAHRVTQARQGALIAYVTAQLWMRDLDTEDIGGSAARLIQRLIPLIERRRTASAEFARRYYAAYRRLEVAGSDGFELPPLTEMNVPALETSLRVTGPVALLGKIKAIPPGDDGRIHPSMLRAAVEETAGQISGAATRHAMNGGRDEIQSALAADPVALGYIRTTDGDPCFFCAMLASRGPVYDDDSFDESDPRFIGEGTHKVHDHCGCGVEPIYSREADWPGRAREFSDRWEELSRKLGRAPTALDWRRFYEGR